MKLPNPDKLVVEREKIVAYLLNELNALITRFTGEFAEWQSAATINRGLITGDRQIGSKSTNHCRRENTLNRRLNPPCRLSIERAWASE